MSKALIVTTQRHFNFGTFLQCYAIQEYLKSQDIEVEILDYLANEYSVSKYRLFRIWLGAFRRKPVNEIGKIFNTLKWLRRNHKFNKFLNNKFRLTSDKYSTFGDLKAAQLNGYDIYIAGSDQIWNPRLNGFKPAYFLKFINDNAFKISYAASFGTDNFTKKDSDEIKELLRGFNAISCRESTGNQFLIDSGFDSQKVLDPTFLLPPRFWRSIEIKPRQCKLNQDFVLTYFLSDNPEKEKIRRSFASDGSPILNLSTTQDASSDSLLDAGPQDFLWLIDNCRLLITDSFHGVVFALIFKKDFYVMPRHMGGENQNARITDLLKDLNLLERWLPTMKIPSAISTVNYSIEYEDKLSSIVEESKRWLNFQLQIKK